MLTSKKMKGIKSGDLSSFSIYKDKASVDENALEFVDDSVLEVVVDGGNMALTTVESTPHYNQCHHSSYPACACLLLAGTVPWVTHKEALWDTIPEQDKAILLEILVKETSQPHHAYSFFLWCAYHPYPTRLLWHF